MRTYNDFTSAILNLKLTFELLSSVIESNFDLMNAVKKDEDIEYDFSRLGLRRTIKRMKFAFSCFSGMSDELQLGLQRDVILEFLEAYSNNQFGANFTPYQTSALRSKAYIEYRSNEESLFFSDGSIIRINSLISIYSNLSDLLIKIASQCGLLNLRAEPDHIESQIRDIYSNVSSMEIAAREASERCSAILNLTENFERLIQERYASIEEIYGESEKTNNLIGEMRLNVSSNKEQSKDYLSNIEVINGQASAVRAQIDEFKASMESNNSKMASLFSDFENLRIENQKIQLEISNETENARKMLSSATNAGLAGNFNEAKERLDLEASKAKRMFYFGCFLLFICSLPITISAFMPIFAVFFGENNPSVLEAARILSQPKEQKNLHFIGSLLGRFILVLPAVWFVSFSAIRYNSLFRLREHYNYKYSMAMSVDGFKIQAPEYASEITSSVLEQLSFNPADKLIPSKQTTEGKELGTLFKLISELMKKKTEEKSDK